MFIDYYAILEIEETATFEEIKIAFRKQANKWHPDRNIGEDTTKQMQRIVEANLILKDKEARQKFDFEFQQFKKFKNNQKEQFQEKKQDSSFNTSTNQNQQKTKTEYQDYIFNDEVLKSWVNNARKQSVELAIQTIKDFNVLIKVGAKEGFKASGNTLITQIIISLVVMVFLSLFKACD